MQVASGKATIDSLRKGAGEQTQELSKRLEQVIFPAASFYCLCNVWYFFHLCATRRPLLEEVSTRSY